MSKTPAASAHTETYSLVKLSYFDRPCSTKVVSIVANGVWLKGGELPARIEQAVIPDQMRKEQLSRGVVATGGMFRDDPWSTIFVPFRHVEWIATEKVLASR